MQTATLIQNGKNQIVNLPMIFPFDTEKVSIKKFGKGILLLPLEQINESTQIEKKTKPSLLAILSTLEDIDKPFPDIDENVLPLDDIKL